MNQINTLMKPETLRSQVENFMREAIMKGQFKAGEKLVERELCEMMGVSRASLREALRKLEAEKLIVNIPHRGPMVSTISLEEAKEIYAFRGLLESYAAHEFARLASDENIEKLSSTVKRLREAAQANSRETVIKVKSEFYEILLDGCANHLVKETLGGLLTRVNLLRSTSLMLADRLPKSLDEIDALVECIRKRDAAGAQVVARNHILNAERAAIGVLQQQNNH